MNRLKIILAMCYLGLFYSCSTTNHAASPDDDVYYSSKDHVQNPPVPNNQSAQPAPADYSTGNNHNSQNDNSNDRNSSQENNPNYSNNTPVNDTQNNYQDQGGNNYSSSGTSSNYSQTQDGQGNTYVTNNYYNDDYYDYAYSARLRRYYSPAYGYNYYDPFYTNLYWYDYNPYSWGVSIYQGYNWWAPSWTYYSPFCYGGFSIGYNSWGYSPWGYSPWGYSPYNSWNSPYSYMNGYNHGYMDGYYSSYYNGYGNYSAYNNPYYYNSLDATSTYYGPRGESGGNSPRQGGRENSGMIVQKTVGEKYVQAIADGRIKASPAIGNGVNTLSGKNRPDVSPQANPGGSKGPASIQPSNGSDSRINLPSKSPATGKNENGSRPVQNSGNQQPSNNGNGKSNVSPFSTPVNSNSQGNHGNEIQPKPEGGKNIGSGTSDHVSQPNHPTSQPANMDQSRPSNIQKEQRNNNWNNQQQQRINNRNNQLRNEEPNQPAPQQPQSPKIQNNDPHRNIAEPAELNEPKQERNNLETPRLHQETRTPILQPRNEPKQYREEKSFSAPRESMPSRSTGGERPSSGGRRK